MSVLFMLLLGDGFNTFFVFERQMTVARNSTNVNHTENKPNKATFNAHNKLYFWFLWKIFPKSSGYLKYSSWRSFIEA